MTTNATSALDDVACCRSVVEYHDPVESDGAPFRPGDTLKQNHNRNLMVA